MIIANSMLWMILGAFDRGWGEKLFVEFKDGWALLTWKIFESHPRMLTSTLKAPHSD
jgi:hypothetical protein